jgi:molecular chaperone Hsp33
VSDGSKRFTIDGAPIRGQVVRLDQTWRQIRSRSQYPPPVERLLGEMVVIAAMLAQGIKLDGSVILQIRGNGPVTTAMAECMQRRRLRGIARIDGEVDAATSVATLCGGGQFAITLKPDKGEPYQSLVELGAGTIADNVEAYFATSEQLPTRIWTAVTDTAAGGLMLQRLPGQPKDDDAWSRMQILAETVKREELLQLPADELLHRLFQEEPVRVYSPSPLEFGCACTRQRSTGALQLMGAAEVEEIITDAGEIVVTCEFCGTRYTYDGIDARMLFEMEPPRPNVEH